MQDFEEIRSWHRDRHGRCVEDFNFGSFRNNRMTYIWLKGVKNLNQLIVLEISIGSMQISALEGVNSLGHRNYCPKRCQEPGLIEHSWDIESIWIATFEDARSMDLSNWSFLSYRSDLFLLSKAFRDSDRKYPCNMMTSRFQQKIIYIAVDYVQK